MDCPECGAGVVSVDVGEDCPSSMNVLSALLEVEESETVVVTRACWECGWSEDRHVTLTDITTQTGDEDVQRRRELLDELVDEAEQIEDSNVLADALAEVKHLRRISLNEMDSDEHRCDVNGHLETLSSGKSRDDWDDALLEAGEGIFGGRDENPVADDPLTVVREAAGELEDVSWAEIEDAIEEEARRLAKRTNDTNED